MAITKIEFPQPGAPTEITAGDYQKQNELIANLINVNNNRVLTEFSTDTIPQIKHNSIIRYAGNLYIVDTANYTIGGTVPSGDGDYYVKISNLTATTLQAEWVNSKSGYVFEESKNAWYNVDDMILTEYVEKTGSIYKNFIFANDSSDNAFISYNSFEVRDKLYVKGSQKIDGKLSIGVDSTPSTFFDIYIKDTSPSSYVDVVLENNTAQQMGVGFAGASVPDLSVRDKFYIYNSRGTSFGGVFPFAIDSQNKANFVNGLTIDTVTATTPIYIGSSSLSSSYSTINFNNGTSGDLIAIDGGGGSDKDFYFYAGNAGNFNWRIGNGSSNTQYMTLTPSGLTVVGNTSSTSMSTTSGNITSGGSISATTNITASSGGDSIILGDTGANSSGLTRSTTGTAVLDLDVVSTDGGSNYIRCFRNGTFTTKPFIIIHDGGTSAQRHLLSGGDTSAYNFLANGQKLKVGSSAAPNEVLDVAGNINSDGFIFANNSSTTTNKFSIRSAIGGNTYNSLLFNNASSIGDMIAIDGGGGVDKNLYFYAGNSGQFRWSIGNGSGVANYMTLSNTGLSVVGRVSGNINISSTTGTQDGDIWMV